MSDGKETNATNQLRTIAMIKKERYVIWNWEVIHRPITANHHIINNVLMRRDVFKIGEILRRNHVIIAHVVNKISINICVITAHKSHRPRVNDQDGIVYNHTKIQTKTQIPFTRRRTFCFPVATNK